MTQRNCESCSACRVVFGFDQKPDHFECEWLKGSLKEEYHPNRIGIVFSIEENRIPLQKRSLVAREAIPNSFVSSKDLLASLAKRKLIVLQKKSSFDFFGSVEEIDRINNIKNRARQQ